MQKMPAKLKQIIKHRRRDKDMESIEIVEIKEKLKEKTKAWEHAQDQEEQDDKTRCWGTCDPVPRPDEAALDEILNWAVVAEIEIT